MTSCAFFFDVPDAGVAIADFESLETFGGVTCEVRSCADCCNVVERCSAVRLTAGVEDWASLEVLEEMDGELADSDICAGFGSVSRGAVNG